MKNVKVSEDKVDVYCNDELDTFQINLPVKFKRDIEFIGVIKEDVMLIQPIETCKDCRHHFNIPLVVG